MDGWGLVGVSSVGEQRSSCVSYSTLSQSFWWYRSSSGSSKTCIQRFSLVKRLSYHVLLSGSSKALMFLSLLCVSDFGPVVMANTELFMTRASPVERRPVELDVLGLLDSFGEENSTAERCYNSHSRSSVLQGLPFGGLPTVLSINVVLWMVLTHTHARLIMNRLHTEL